MWRIAYLVVIEHKCPLQLNHLQKNVASHYYKSKVFEKCDANSGYLTTSHIHLLTPFS